MIDIPSSIIMPYSLKKMDIRLLSLYVKISFKNAFKQFFERSMVKTFDFREKKLKILLLTVTTVVCDLQLLAEICP